MPDLRYANKKTGQNRRFCPRLPVGRVMQNRVLHQIVKAGINRDAVTGVSLEPLVQVGTAGDASGFPLEAGMHNGIAVQFPR